jgi:hypothetical protein
MYDCPVYSSSSLFVAHGHRTTFFDGAMRRYLDAVEQVVILGAGWDTRACGLAWRKGVCVLEDVSPPEVVSSDLTKRDLSCTILASLALHRKADWLSSTNIPWLPVPPVRSPSVFGKGNRLEDQIPDSALSCCQLLCPGLLDILGG